MMAVAVRWLASLPLLIAVGCMAHPTPAARAVRQAPDGMRIVYLARAGDDQSCLDGRGGTFVPRDLPDAEVRELEVLIRQTDKMPIRAMRFLKGVCAPEVCGELLASTGIECGGALSGSGHDFSFRRRNRVWSLISQDDWNG